LANKWLAIVKKEFTAAHPNVTVDPVPLAGTYDDIVTKESLLYRSASTSPDVAITPTPEVGQFASAGFLLPLNSYVKSTSWWKGFPKIVQSQDLVGSKLYAVSAGLNTQELMYDKVLFKKAGLPVPWQPKTWADVLAAAKKLKAALPNVIPIFLMTGVGSGASTTNYGINNFIDSTSSTTIYDTKTEKWVVDSPGIDQALNFYREVYASGLGAPVSMLESPNSDVEPCDLFPSGKLGITLASNYFEGEWVKAASNPYWPQAPADIAVTPLPTEYGASPGYGTTLDGWDYAVGAKSQHPQLAFDLISLMEDAQNSVNMGNWAGWIPPNAANWHNPSYVNFAPYQLQFSELVPHSILTPTQEAYPVWVQGMNLATGSFAQNSSTKVSQAVQTLKSYVAEELGSKLVETLG
jgi:multiple sugar transport system substrate-binding protein